jgi:hypothetical protein
MTTREQVVQQMLDAGLPALPVGHPILDGKYKRFGPGKTCWYILRELTLKSGRIIVTGAFGQFHGEDRGTQKVKMEYEEMSAEERAESLRKQAEAERKEAEAKERDQRMAANRAKDQWSKGKPITGIDGHPYLVRKQVPSCGLRCGMKDLLLIPMRKRGGLGDIAGLQKITTDGEKLYNKDMDKIGAAYRIEAAELRPDLANIEAIGEGYATCASVHLAVGMNVTVAFDAGSIISVAREVRAAYPDRHILFLADDDYLLQQRFVASMLKRFKFVADDIAIDGQTYTREASDGESVSVMAQWLTDVHGLQYIVADVRKGRQVANVTFRNAGRTACMAAVAELGNASVVYPVFDDRKGEKLTDFNDLHVVQSLDAVASQINAALARVFAPVENVTEVSGTEDAFAQAAQQLHDNLPPSEDDALFDQAVAVVTKNQRASISLVQRELRIGYNRAARLIEAMEVKGIVSPMRSDGGRDVVGVDASPAHLSLVPVSPAPPVEDVPDFLDVPVEGFSSPPPPSEDGAEIVGLVPLKWALRHCALIQGSTDVWDSVNQVRMKKAAFIDMVGKATAKVWSSHEDRRSISPRNLPQLVRGVAKQQGGAGEDNIVVMLDRYTLLYGTKTIWDADRGIVVNYDALLLARGDLATRWLSHPMRREIDHDKLVFDPTEKVDLTTHINMFEGFKIKPVRDFDKASKALKLLESLCATESNSAEVFEWVLKWLAYPLQHPGAKMQTALLFFGHKQGTGKSLFFEGIIKPIYGKHGATGNQTQLDANYSTWRSQKLYVLFEEILSRQDKYNSFGLVKHLITGRDMTITQKFKDDRTENNHTNVVMLSNEFQAVPIEPDDRRFEVVEAKQPLDDALRLEVTALLDDGLIEAVYDFLLCYPLGDFNPHTKPIMTRSKQRMIEFGRPDWEVFLMEWSSGNLNAPYCTCLATDLFLVYEKFCSLYNFRALNIKKFSELIAGHLDRDRQWITLGVKARKLLTIFHVPSDKGESNSQQCERFRKAAGIKDEDQC